MAERDWLSELSEAIGDDAPPPPAPAVDDELHLQGPGRPLAGWAVQLADAIGEEHPAPAPVPAPAPAPPRSDAPAFSTWDGAPLAAEPVSRADTDARLARVEALLGADLNKLGPAVLAESVAAIEARVEAALGRLAALDAPLAALEERVTAHARTLAEPVRVTAVVPAELAEALTELSARFAALEHIIEEATTEIDDGSPVGGSVDLAPVQAAIARQQHDQSQAQAAINEIGQILLGVKAKVDDLAARPISALEPGTAQPMTDFEPMLAAITEQRTDTNALAVILRHLQESLGELLDRPAPEAPPTVDFDPLLRAVVDQHGEIAAVREVVAELASRPQPSVAPVADLAPVEAVLTEQRRELTGIANSVAAVEELRQLVAQLYSAVVDVAARPSGGAAGEDVRQELVELVQAMARHQDELVARVDAATDNEIVTKRLGSLNSRLLAVEKRLGEAAGIDELIRQAIADLAGSIERLERRLGG